MRRVFKYATGEPIPDGAVYLSTVAQSDVEVHDRPNFGEPRSHWEACWLVWHYFLVEVEAARPEPQIRADRGIKG